MDPSSLSLFITLKGTTKSSQLLQVPEPVLRHFVQSQGSDSNLFFTRVIDCIQSLLDSSTPQITSEYFGISEVLCKSLTDPTCDESFLTEAKNILSSFEHRLVCKGTQTVPESPKQNPIKSVTLPKIIDDKGGVLNKGNKNDENLNKSENVTVLPQYFFKRTVNVLEIGQHKPVRGTISNPDYSYNSIR